ncbi:MAG: hypothetical protein ISS71_00205 [Phycisphaerae bacterium]|nr:hypothetical protein [Phycisphaerae bacterium]
MSTKSFLTIIFLQTILSFFPCSIEAQETADWWKSHQDTKIALLDQQIPIAQVVAKVSAKTPKNAQDAMFKLNIFLRVGMNKEAIDALQELKALNPQMENPQIAEIYYDACSEFAAWDVAKATVEIFVDNISELTLYNRLLEHLTKAGWTFEQVDSWLANMPKGIDNYWIKQRLSFNAQYGKTAELVQKLSDIVRKNPQNIEGATAFLDALTHIGSREFSTLDLSWMAETVHSESAAQTAKIASILKTLEQWKSAIQFYRQAISIPLTEAEVRNLSHMYQARPQTNFRALFAVNVRESMAECLLKLGNNSEAQKWMVEAATIRQENNLDLNAFLAGRVQQASGQRTIEEQIKAKEEFSKNNPEYWQQRARYYWGRNEPNQQEVALLKGFALTAPQPEPNRPYGKGYQDRRSSILGDYVRFLQQQHRDPEAVALLCKEIKEVPATAESSKRAAYLLASEFKKYVSADDPVLWNWLTNRPIWENTEQRLLWCMLVSTAPKDLDKHFTYAETLAFGNDPTRANTLGWAMNRMRFAQRSIPLLEYAVENTDNKELKESAQFTLFESYLAVSDWKNAEKMFPFACSRLGVTEIPEWYSKIAIIAAKSGNKADALQIWKQMANLSPYYMGGLETLADNGLKADLIQFYQNMHEVLPKSEMPAKALLILEK